MSYKTIYVDETIIKNRRVFVIKGKGECCIDILAKVFWVGTTPIINYCSDELELELSDAAKILQLALNVIDAAINKKEANQMLACKIPKYEI